MSFLNHPKIRKPEILCFFFFKFPFPFICWSLTWVNNIISFFLSLQITPHEVLGNKWERRSPSSKGLVIKTSEIHLLLHTYFTLYLNLPGSQLGLDIEGGEKTKESWFRLPQTWLRCQICMKIWQCQAGTHTHQSKASGTKVFIGWWLSPDVFLPLSLSFLLYYQQPSIYIQYISQELAFLGGKREGSIWS